MLLDVNPHDHTAATALHRKSRRGLSSDVHAMHMIRSLDTIPRALLQDAGATESEHEQAPVHLADEVGEIYLYHHEDLKRIAPLWWNYSMPARAFPETHTHVSPWSRFAISELMQCSAPVLA